MAAIKVSEADTLTELKNILTPLGYTISSEQPHIGGEREFMSAHKLVLIGSDTQGRKVVIKTSKHADGIREVKHDKAVRDLLTKLSFANDELLQPKEYYYGESEGYVFLITEYIEQERVFVDRPIEEQFFIILRAFEAQEGFHATTYGHGREVKEVFAVYTPETYLSRFGDFTTTIAAADQSLLPLLQKAQDFLKTNRTTLERYGNHLTHNDFVPHNMRIKGREIYVLDQTSFWFGNKYEGWARFINYMELHNSELAKLLLSHIKTYRPEEFLDLTLMRIYKLGMVLNYHASILSKVEGDLRILTEKRLAFWSQMLRYVLNNEPIPEAFIKEYAETRDLLRSEKEKSRQREFAKA